MNRTLNYILSVLQRSNFEQGLTIRIYYHDGVLESRKLSCPGRTMNNNKECNFKCPFLSANNVNLSLSFPQRLKEGPAQMDYCKKGVCSIFLRVDRPIHKPMALYSIGIFYNQYVFMYY